MSAPGLDDRAALAWVLAGEYLDALLPSDIKAALRPRFDAARKVLSQTPFARTRRWAERVTAKPKGYQLLPPKLEAGVPEAVQQALLDRRRLSTTCVPATTRHQRPTSASSAWLFVAT